MSMIMDDEEFAQFLRAPVEGRAIECKESQEWPELRDKIAKTAMAMANLRDGGMIVIGVDERSGRLCASGVAPDVLKSYTHDKVSAYINKYADPFVNVSVQERNSNGRFYVVISVSEFEAIPVICKKNSGDSFNAGDLYVRSHSMPETCKVNSQTDMREVVEMAIDKGIELFLARASRLGVLPTTQTDAELFDQQLGGL